MFNEADFLYVSQKGILIVAFELIARGFFFTTSHIVTARHSIVCSNMQSVRTPWYADTYPDMHVCGPIYILIPRYMNVQSSVQMHIVGARYRVRTSPISRA